MACRVALALAVLASVAQALDVAVGLGHGDRVFVSVPRTDRRFTTQPDGFVHAFWHHRGKWQRFEIERAEGPGTVVSGDAVLLKAWTGRRLTAQGRAVHAHWSHAGKWQQFVIEAKGAEAGAPIMPGSTIFLQAHTGKRVDADAPDSPGVVQARFNHKGSWQELVIELHSRAATTTTQPPGGAAPGTTAAPPVTTATTTTTIPLCAELSSEAIPGLLTVKAAELPTPISSACGGMGSRRSCRHGFYAASAETDLHALLYNDIEGRALLVLIDGEDDVAGEQDLGAQEVRGLQFEPGAEHLVALISGGTGIQNSPSYFVKVHVPSLAIVWRKPVESPVVGMEKWTPDNADAIAVSEDRYVLHSAGVCREGTSCEGRQGDLIQVLNATTGERLDEEGKDFSAARSCKQMVAYNPLSESFLFANAGDDPAALQFSSLSGGEHRAGAARFESWGDGRGRQGVTQGAVRADPDGPGFAAVWSYGDESGQSDKLHFARIDEAAAFAVQPHIVFPHVAGTEIGAGLVSLGGGRWLVGYTEADQDIVTDYLQTFWDDWGVPDEVRAKGSRLAVLDASGAVLGTPVNVAALGAPIPVEINHLAARPDGVGWVAISGPGRSAFTVAHLRCRRGA